MQASNVNFMNEILNNRRFYYIPVYQRNYSWQEEQCKQLFRDIKKLYDGEYDEHFIGTIVWKADDGNSSRLSVIDGQQRLTTMFLLVIAMYELNEDPELKRRLEDIMYDYTPDKVRLVPIKSDNEVYELIVKGESADVKNKSSRIYANFIYFKEMIQAEELDLKHLFDTLCRLSAIKMELDVRDNPQIVFESINSTGMSLSIADLIRNYLLMNESYEQQTYLFEKYWYKFEQKLGVENLIYFFEQYLNIKTIDKKINRNEMYGAFKEYFIKVNRSAEELLIEVEPYIEIYEKLINDEIDFEYDEDKKVLEEINRIKNELISLENKTTYLFLLPTVLDYQNGVITFEELHYAFKLTLSYIFRRAVVGLGTNVLQNTFRRLHKQTMDNHSKFDYKNSLDYALIVSKRNSNAVFPTDKEFFASLHSRNLYGKFRFVKYLLLSLENKGNKSMLSRESLTIEHVMPQTTNKQWQKILGDNWKELHEENVNDLGNLTLTSYNSDLSNYEYLKKKEILLEERHIKLNDHFIDVAEWNIAAIENRGRILANQALQIWAYPEIDNTIEDKVNEERYNKISLNDLLEEYMSIKPAVLVIDNQEYQVKSYREIMKRAIEKCVADNQQKFEEKFVDNEDYTRINRGERYYVISKDKNKVIVPKEAAKYYYDTNRSGYNLCFLAKELLELIDVNVDDVIIKYYK